MKALNMIGWFRQKPRWTLTLSPAQFVAMLCSSLSELEWRLSEAGAVKTDLEENPKKQIEDKLMSSIRSSLPARQDSDSEGD